MLKLPAKNKRLLLQTCCAPCSAPIIKELQDSKIDFAVFFYNPNIFPQKEYDLRKNELIRYCQKVNVPIIIAESEKTKKQWEECVEGLELEPERGKRCEKCITHRMEKTAKYAQKEGFDLIATTLSASRWKDFFLVNKSGETAVQDILGVDFWAINWRKEVSEESFNKIPNEEKFYRQKYCGCFYSIGDNLK